MKTYRVTFERIGRTHTVAPMLVEVADGDELAKLIHKYARPYLRSRDYEVELDLDEGKGFITAGFHSGGDFTLTEMEPA
jgi:hypothetical protein